MANPRVFISSTCYDLTEVRDSLLEFIESYGFEPVLSERGDVFYHPAIHTQDSCLNEVGNCQLFILIIGGRFGGSYIADPKKSIVNAEYAAAIEQKIPVFTFIKSNVYSDHHLYLKNRKSPSLNNIIFPSIEDNSHAEKIFTFIENVRHAPVNNGFFQFNLSRDITTLLRKQLAGMFYDFLQERTSSDQLKKTTNLLKNISIAGEKVEELVKSLYRHVDSTGASDEIDRLEKYSIVKEFFDDFFTESVINSISKDYSEELVNTPREGKWYEYLAKATDGRIETNPVKLKNEEQGEIKVMIWDNFVELVEIPLEVNSEFYKTFCKQHERFQVLKELSNKELIIIIKDMDIFNIIRPGDGTMLNESSDE